MSRTPLALIRGVKKLCKDLGVDPEDVRTFRFFTPPPPSISPHSHALVCLFVFFFLCCSCMASCFTFARPHQPCAWLSSIKRGHIIIITITCLYLKLMSSNNFLYICSSLTLQQNKVRHSCHFHGCQLIYFYLFASADCNALQHGNYKQKSSDFVLFMNGAKGWLLLWWNWQL